MRVGKERIEYGNKLYRLAKSPSGIRLPTYRHKPHIRVRKTSSRYWLNTFLKCIYTKELTNELRWNTHKHVTSTCKCY